MANNERLFYGTCGDKVLSVCIHQSTLDYLCCETIIPYRDGNDLLVIHRYGQDDYSVWFTDADHLTDDTYGSSVRGSLRSIIDEIKEVL